MLARHFCACCAGESSTLPVRCPSGRRGNSRGYAYAAGIPAILTVHWLIGRCPSDRGGKYGQAVLPRGKRIPRPTDRASLHYHTEFLCQHSDDGEVFYQRRRNAALCGSGCRNTGCPSLRGGCRAEVFGARHLNQHLPVRSTVDEGVSRQTNRRTDERLSVICLPLARYAGKSA